MKILKQIKGTRFDGKYMKETTVVMRVTSDWIGKTLSLADERGTSPVMLTIPLEPVLNELQKALEG